LSLIKNEQKSTVDFFDLIFFQYSIDKFCVKKEDTHFSNIHLKGRK